MLPTAFVSVAARGEDVVLHRALGGLTRPRFLELSSAGGPARCTSLLQHGWETYEALDGSPADADGAVLHALVVERTQEPPALDLLAAGARPWIVLAPADFCLRDGGEGGSALATALVGAGYTPALFDGASQYYVEPEHVATLLPQVDHPAGPDDGFVTATTQELRARVAELEAAQSLLMSELVAWRARAVVRWSESTGSGGGRDAERLSKELDALKSTLSWRVTAPMRAVRRRIGAR